MVKEKSKIKSINKRLSACLSWKDYIISYSYPMRFFLVDCLFELQAPRRHKCECCALCVITRHPSISSTLSLSNTWPWGTISLQSHHSRNCVGGCHSICSTFHMMQQWYIAFVQCAVMCSKVKYRTERKSMDMYNTFMSSLCNINNIGNIWC